MATSTSTLPGRRGTWQHLSSLCVAGVALSVADVALGDNDLHFAWQALLGTSASGVVVDSLPGEDRSQLLAMLSCDQVDFCVYRLICF